MSGAVRLFCDPCTGNRYRVRITPIERRGSPGADSRMNALVFETEDGEWVGPAPLYHNVMLESLSVAELLRFLIEAMGRV